MGSDDRSESNNSPFRLGSELTSSIRQDSWNRDSFKNSPRTDSFGNLTYLLATVLDSNLKVPLASEEAPRRKTHITKEQLLAYRSYVNDIDFVNDQKNYINTNGFHVPRENVLADYLLVSANLISGYTLTSQLTSVNLSSMLFYAEGDEGRVLIRLSPNYVESISVARFLNEWYVTSGINPKKRRLWSHTQLANDHIAATDTGPGNSRDALSRPITLPDNVPGILYPLRMLNIEYKHDQQLQRRMGLVYPDYGYQTIHDFHERAQHTGFCAENRSHSGSIRSVLSDLSADKPVHNRFTRNGLGGGVFDDLANRVSQLPKTRPAVIDILSDIISVVTTLSICHALGIVHNGVTGHSILRATDLEAAKRHRVVLTGWDFSFSIAAEDSSNSYRQSNISDIPDFLPYMSPENTGETAGKVDYRSDFYSVGIVLYELIVGCLPFQSDNPVRLRKMHLSQNPISPLVLGQGWITRPLSDLIMKCLEKNQDDRYLEAQSLLSDLKKVKRDYQRSDLDDEPHLAIEDDMEDEPEETKVGTFPYLYTGMTKLRYSEVREQVFDCFNSHTEGVQYIIISGDAGVGKTTMLQEMRALAVSRYNFYIPWAYNCTDVDVTSYASAIHGMHAITKQILASSKENIAEWRHIFTSEIDTDLSILFHAIPEMKVLLGPRYKSIRSDKNKAPEQRNSTNYFASGVFHALLEEEESGSDGLASNKIELSGFDDHALNLELKFRYIIKKLFSLIGPSGLTVVLDDLHWCPPGETHFLKEIADFCSSGSSTPRITVVGAYRTSPPASLLDQPKTDLTQMLNILSSNPQKIHTFELAHLNAQQFKELIDNSAFPQGRGNPSRGDEVAKALYTATDGNILQFRYLIRTLHLKADGGAIDFGQFARDFGDTANPICANKIVKDYVDLAINENARSMLKFAAIITSCGYFKLSDLLIVTGRSLKEIYELLQQCIETKLIVPAGIYYKVPFHLIASSDFPFDLSDADIWELTTRSRYYFDHDIIQMYFLKELADSREWHLHQKQCGLRYRKKMSTDANVNVTAYLTMASHLLNACSLVDENEQEIFYDSLVTAGRFSLATSNLTLALTFFNASDKLISPQDTRRRMKSMLTICQMNYYLKNYQESINIIQRAEEEFGTESRTFLYLKVRCLFHLKQFKKGMRISLKGLESLGIEVSGDRSECQQIAEKYFGQLPLSIADIRNMRFLPKATDQKFLLIADLIMDVIGPTYMLGLFHLRHALLAQLFQLMHTYGTSTSCALPLIHFANYFVQPNEQSSTLKACELSEIALGLVNSDEGASTSLTEHIYESYVIYMAPFKHTITELVKFSDLHGFLVGSLLKVRDTSMSLFVSASGFFLSFLNGNSTATQFRLILKRLAKIFDNEDDQAVFKNALSLWLHEITFEQYQESKFSSRYGPDLEFCYLANAVIWCAAEGRFEEAAEIILDRAFRVLRKLPISILHLEFYFHGAVCLCLNSSHATRKLGLNLAKKILKLFESWAEVCPPNFASKSIIIRACLRSSDSQKSSLAVLDDFEESIEIATKEGRWIEVALANHLCASWLRAKSESTRRSSYYAQNALSMYTTLKADRQAERLKKEFSSVFDHFNWAGIAMIPDHKRPSTPQDMKQLNRKLLLALAGGAVGENKIGSHSVKSIAADGPANLRMNSCDDLATQNELTKAIEFCLTISESSNTDSIVCSLLESVLLFSGVDYGAIVLSSNTAEPTVKAIGTLKNLYKLENESLSSRTDLVPYMMVIHCLLTGETINKDDNPANFDRRFGKDHYYLHNSCSSAVCIPIKTQTVLGAIYLEKHMPNVILSQPFFDARKMDLLLLLCSQAAVSFSKSAVYSQMELAKKAAEDATAEKASFLANMSHEIRTPFNSLFACSLFLLDTDLNATQREYVETIKNSALVTLSIIDGILAFSKIEHGSFTLENSLFSINECIESAIQISSEQAISNDLELAYFNRCPEIDEVVGDSTRIRQIIINLVGNAVKFTQHGYIKIVLAAEHIKDNRYEIKFSVEDTGIGIPERSTSKVFGAFSQVDGSSIRVFGGSGLGLSISKKLADIMNGKLHFDSTEGKGTTFYFSCPLEGKRKECHLVKAQRVAIVERECLARQSFKEMLEFFKSHVSVYDDIKSLADSLACFDKLFISYSFLDQFKEVRHQLQTPTNKVYLVAQFGKAISNFSLEEIGVETIIFTPLKRKKIEDILQDAPQQVGVDKKLPAGSAKCSKLADKHPLRILIAEDNAINLRVALQHLKKLGYLADHAKDGVEALEKCEAKLAQGDKYDVIFMDIQMPRKDGIAAAIELKESFILRGFADYLPEIVALTANVAGEDRDRCLNCGMIDFVSKPILPEELHRVLTKVGTKLDVQ